MPPINKPATKTAAKRVIAQGSPDTQPLTVDAAKEIAPQSNAPAPEVEAPIPGNIEQMQQLAAISAPSDIIEHPDGSITVNLNYPVEVDHGIPPFSSLTLKRCLWKYRCEAARAVPENATSVDHDTALICVLSGKPELAIGMVDARDMANVQMALGKLLYTPQMLSGN